MENPLLLFWVVAMDSNAVKNDIKSNIVKYGFTMTEIVKLINVNRDKSNKITVQNLSNKLTRGTIKYSEVIEIANVMNMEIKWSSRGIENE